MSFDKLIDRIKVTNNPTVVGLDPKLAYIPEFIKQKAFALHGQTLAGGAAALLEYNMGIIDAIKDIVPAVKPQSAFYEAFGWEGVRAFAQTVEYAKKCGMYVIADAKRGDIGSTMETYADGFLGKTDVCGTSSQVYGADALTVNAYLGTDGVMPAVKICKAEDKGIFVLVKTSNPSSGELQDKLLEGETLYATMGRMCEKWGEGTVGKHGYSAVGAVVGATYPAQLEELRALMPNTFFLVPGYGAQGGAAADVAGAFDQDGMGAIVNSSRAVLTAWQKTGRPEAEYAAAAADEAVRMRDEIVAAVRAGR